MPADSALLRRIEVDCWPEVKLDIVRRYAAAFSARAAGQDGPARTLYVEAFGGAGVRVFGPTRRFVAGNPLNVLLVQPAFREVHLIDLDGGRAAALRRLAAGRPEVSVHEGDLNEVLEKRILPRCRPAEGVRALWLLDPCGLQLDWSVTAAAGRTKSIDVFLCFPAVDRSMHALWRRQGRLSPLLRTRMDTFWGGSTWHAAASAAEGDSSAATVEADKEGAAGSFRERLETAAGFKYVAPPLPLRNARGAVVSHLLFAAPGRSGHQVVEGVMARHKSTAEESRSRSAGDWAVRLGTARISYPMDTPGRSRQA